MKIAVFCASTTGNNKNFRDGAHALGTWIGAHGHTLVYGGAQGGLMGIVADAVLAAGGKVIGVLPNVPSIQARRHPALTEYIDTADMAERKAKMTALADAFAALPGGVGTLDEITDIFSLLRLELVKKPCVLVDIDGFYQPLKAFVQSMADAGFMGADELGDVLVSADMEEIGAFIEGKTSAV